MKIKLVGLNARYIHSCPALFYLRRQLLRQLPELRPEIVQKTINDPYYPALLGLAAGRPEALFFSVYIWNSTYVGRLVRDLLALLPETRIVLGGPEAPYLFGRHGEIGLERCTVVRGEVEGLGEEFFRDLRAGCLAPRYAACRRVNGEDFPLPYGEEDFAGPLANRHIYYESSRGCPFSCAYCLSAGEHGVRAKELDQVRGELRAILQQRPKVLRFVDRTFNDRPERALEIWRFLATEAEETLCHFEIAPDRFTEEMFSFLESLPAGRFQFEIGVQSTHPPTLAAVSRRMDFQAMRANLRRLAALDTVHIHADLILGLPLETVASFRAGLAELFALGPHYIQMGLLKLLPDTPLAAKQHEYGLRVCAAPPYEVLATSTLAPAELAGLYWLGEITERFYNNRYFQTLWQYLRSCGEDMPLFFDSLLAVCRQHGFFELAPTQELLARMLAETVASRPDASFLHEVLAYDWLRSGQRLLPDFLRRGLQAVEPPALKKMLWERLPESWPGYYSHHERRDFLKRAVVGLFSASLLAAAGLAGGGGKEVCLLFLAERLATVHGHQRVAMAPLDMAGEVLSSL